MSLQAGSRLGPYEVLGLLGAGGMGEVFRARDTRLDRAVALKVLPAALAPDSDLRRRFEREARAIAALGHPHICTIYDVGREAGVDFLVMEYLEGQTLAERLEEGPLPLDLALRCGQEIALALEEAHRRGIVHRDLKPGNVMLTKTGVKLLDFGVAKLREPPAPAGDAATRTVEGSEPPLTGRGETLGTLPYMAPEQLEGEEADARTDIFALGVVLYEMATGRKAFTGKSRASLAAAILTGEPQPMANLQPLTPPGLERVVKTCLAKNPDDRWQTAREARLALRWVQEGTPGADSAPALARPKRRTRRIAAVVGAALAASALLGWMLAHLLRPEPSISFRRLTFQRGNILNARFARDGDTLVYGAAWEGRPAEVFLTRTDGTGSRPLALPSADILALSTRDEMAILLKKGALAAPTGGGMLTIVPLTGGAPRELLDDVTRADFGPDGGELAVVHAVGGMNRIEYPIGHVLYETPFWIRAMRVAPDGSRVAFVENTRDLLSALKVVDRQGEVRVVAADWSGLLRVAWWGDEVVFGGGPTYAERALRAASPSGELRVLVPSAGSNLQVHDIAADGRLLVERAIDWHGILARGPTDDREIDLSWMGASFVQDLSSDGRTLLFTEDGDGGGPKGGIFLRRLDGAPAVRLGEGSALALSPDGLWVSSVGRDAEHRMTLLPTGAGEPRPLVASGVVPIATAAFLAGSRELVYAGSDGGRRPRLWVQPLAGGRPRALTPEGVALGLATSPDGSRVAVNGFDGGGIYPLDGGEKQAILGLEPLDVPIQWSDDDAHLYLIRRGEVPTRIVRLELATGARRPWRELNPAAGGVLRIKTVAISRDGLAYAYSYDSALASDLFVVELRRAASRP